MHHETKKKSGGQCRSHNTTDWLIIADGEPLLKSTTQQWAKNKSILVLDGALPTVLDDEITPQIVMGDFDSVDPTLLNKIKENHAIKFIQDTNKNTTDLEKALHYLSAINATSVTLCHATGRRLDHTLYNLRLLKRFHAMFEQLQIITALEKIYFFSDCTIQLFSKTKQPLALLAFPNATIHSTHLEYELHNLELKFSIQESISNAILPGEATIKIRGDVLLLISHSTKIVRC